METNFKMVVHHNSDNLHVKLVGDFDGTSADRLIKLLDKYRSRAKKIFVHTGSLNKVESAGRELFHKNHNLPVETLTDLVFTGDHAERIAPYSWQVL
jgi:hypothetical protein